MTFDDLGLSKSVLRAVSAAGYSIPTPIQAQAIPIVLEGRDLLGSAQTGTGKTAAFALPILHRLSKGKPANGSGRKIRCLVLAPTRELASQIADSFREYGNYTSLRHAVIYGGVSQVPQTRQLQKGVDILVATPGRLLDLFEQGFVDFRSVQTLVLDEADRMLDMGFMPDIRRIIAELPEKRQTLFFSATMPAAIQKLADSVLTDPERILIEPTKANTAKIEQSVYFVPQRKKSQVLDQLLSSQPHARTVVFTRTKHGADSVTERLQAAGFRVDVIHGNKSQSKRQKALLNFKRNRIQVLVATDVAARGIDVEDISHVVNYDLPHEPETYIHRIGRTGRAGASGVAISFCDLYERKHLRAIEREIRQPLTVVSTDPGMESYQSREGMERKQPATPSRPSSDRRFPKRKNGRPPRSSDKRGQRRFSVKADGGRMKSREA